MSETPTRYSRILAWFDHYLLRRLYIDRVRRLILQSFPFWYASVVMGGVAVGYERLFGWAINRLQPAG